MVMATNFGPLTTGRYMYSSTSQSIDPELFLHSWKAQGSSGTGKLALAEYKICPPTNSRAYFHMLLDASGSTWQRVKSGDKKRVYKHLFQHFADVVTKGDTFRPHDMICVWSFNKRTTLLCAVERRHFPAQLDSIRALYKKELDGADYKETRLYDAVAVVMDAIRETHKEHPEADFFLVPFTDGVDNKSESVTLDGMMQRMNALMGRLHTFFITVNLPRDSELLRRLATQQSEITHHDCESAEPGELARAFNTLRECVKAFLLMAYTSGEAMQLTRIADYGRTKQEVAHRMMVLLSQEMHNTSLMEGWNSLASLGPA
jgi:hypothetical protein